MTTTDKVTAMVREDCLVNGVSLNNVVDVSMVRLSMPSGILVERHGDGKSETSLFVPKSKQDDEINALHDEIERLRSCLSDADENACWILGENAKLRELVREAAEVASPDFDVRDWPMGHRLRYIEEARDLGIEVDA